MVLMIDPFDILTSASAEIHSILYDSLTLAFFFLPNRSARGYKPLQLNWLAA